MSKVHSTGKASIAIEDAQPRQRERGWLVWAFWTVSYALGGTIGGLASGWFTEAIFPDGGAGLGLSVSLPQLAVGILGTLVFGSIIGLATWLVLRMHIEGRALWLWIPLTAAGLTLGSLIALMAIPSVWVLPSDSSNFQQVALLNDTINSAVIGLMIGIAQAALLSRRVSDRASLITFVLTSALGWLGLTLLASLLISATEGMTGLGAARQLGILLVSFAVAGAISGIELPALLKKSKQEPAKEIAPDDNPAAAGAN